MSKHHNGPLATERAIGTYVFFVAAVHVLATWMAGTQAHPGSEPYLTGGACIVVWLIFWWFYRRYRAKTDLRRAFEQRVFRMEQRQAVRAAVREAQAKEAARVNQS